MEYLGKSLLLENRYLLSSVSPSAIRVEREKNSICLRKRRGRLRRSAKLFATHLQSVKGITN
jgi:hypothetical protein